LRLLEKWVERSYDAPKKEKKNEHNITGQGTIARPSSLVARTANAHRKRGKREGQSREESIIKKKTVV
jgi:hypothetical protein